MALDYNGQIVKDCLEWFINSVGRIDTSEFEKAKRIAELIKIGLERLK
jgi:hypothetical protein